MEKDYIRRKLYNEVTIQKGTIQEKTIQKEILQKRDYTTQKWNYIKKK